MRAYQLPKGGAGTDALVKVERPDPKPAYRRVLVKVAACSLNFRDLGIVHGSYRMPGATTSFRCPMVPARCWRSVPPSRACGRRRGVYRSRSARSLLINS